MLQCLDDVFRPVFCHFPRFNRDGTLDKTTWTPRDPSPYINAWRDTAEWREHLQPGANAKGLRFSREDVAPIVHHITVDFIDKHANKEQRQDSFNKNKSRAEARLNRECGSRHVANVIWQLGLPNAHALQNLAIATENVLQWLTKLADLIQAHKATPGYKENRRKSGDSYGRSGLTHAELEAKKEKRKERHWERDKWLKKW